MATHVSHISALQDEKLVTPYSEVAAKPQVKTDILVRLATFLQTTLDYQKILTIFKREIAGAVLIDGMTYQHSDHNIQFSLGKIHAHSCSYQLKAKNEGLGEITFTRATRFREHEMANLEALMGTLVYPLRNAIRYRAAIDQAFKDPLTGAGNRIALEDSLKRELELVKRHDLDLSLLMLDLDHFKPINDEFGHLVGDEVLKVVASKIKECIRQTDMYFRYGGEEFVVLLNNANIANARLIAERIRMGISSLVIQAQDSVIQPTVSIGLAVCKKETIASSTQDKDLIHRADKALYEAKASGRNKVCCAPYKSSPAEPT